MTTSRPDRATTSATLDRIFETQIQPALVDSTPAVTAPTAVLVAGPPGSGRDHAAERIRLNLAYEGRSPLIVSAAQLRPFHPMLRNAGPGSPQLTEDAEQQMGRWYAQVVQQAIGRPLDLILSSSFREPQVALALAVQLRSAGYSLSAVVVACDRDRCRQVALAQYDLTRSLGLTPHLATAAALNDAYDRLPSLVSQLESERSVDRLQIISEDGRLVYANVLAPNGQWQQNLAGAERLHDYRERRRTPRDLAHSALRWQTLAQRLSKQRDVPRDIASLAVAWRNEAVQLAERDAEAAVLLQRGREAEAFRVMERGQLLSEFPQLGKAVAKMDEAEQYASKTFVEPEERQRFVAQARERIAERIAEGRLATRTPEAPARSPRTR